MTMVAAGSRILVWRLVQKVGSALAVVLIAGHLGPVGQGHFALTMTVAMILAAALNGGIGLAAVPALRQGEVAPRRALAAQLLWAGALAVVLAAAGALAWQSSLRGELVGRLGWDGVTLAATVVAILALVLFDVHTYNLLAAGRLVAGTLVGGLRAAGLLAVVAALVAFDRLTLFTAVGSFAAVHAAGALAIVVLAWRAARGPAPPAPATPLLALTGHLLRRGWVGQLSAVSYLLLLRVDQGFLEFAHGAAAVGIYSIAVWAGEMLWLVPEALNPLLVHSSADASDPAARDATAARAVRLALVVTAAGGLALALTARPLLDLLLGGAYRDSVPALLALLPGVVAIAPGAVLAGDFIGRGRPVWNTQASILTMAVRIVLCLLLIPAHGAVGAAWSSSISYAFGSLLMVMRFRRTTGVRWRSLLIPRLADFRR